MARLPKGREAVMYLRQSHLLAKDGGAPLFAMVQWQDDRNGCEAFLQPGQYPPFDGPGAWFRLIRHKKGAYTFLERVAEHAVHPYLDAAGDLDGNA